MGRVDVMAKRFWADVTLDSDDDGHFIRLDGRALKTPGKRPVRVPSAAIAAQLKHEWDAVPAAEDGEIDPTTMPVTRLANVASERVADRRDALIGEARNYAGTDLLSYRAPDPVEYVARQAAAWNPWLDWAAERGVRLETTDAIRAVDQPDASLDAVAEYARDLSDFALTLFVHLVAVYGSAVLAMAVMEGALPPEDAFDLSRLEELHREEIWGRDEEAFAARLALRTETATLGGLAAILD
ncbi:ATP12 family protein [uncultured Algimonas sp.]|uniref:ATP12 family chaperone protein n=1 Tax=uncultured Algimonas sp. TaxID=1547920 RepID=UPI0026260DFB|nr:ATP12 family protein [uncultured Algimonas sp.]